jgi:hypothetical protein
MADVQFFDTPQQATNYVSLKGTILTFNYYERTGSIEGVWISSTLFGVDLHGSYSTSWKIFEFLQNDKVNIYDIPSTNTSIKSNTVPGQLTIQNAIKSLPSASGNYTGTIPHDTIDLARDKINLQEQELYQVYGSNIESIQSHYQATLMTGLLVAMFGTTVLFFTFRQL